MFLRDPAGIPKAAITLSSPSKDRSCPLNSSIISEAIMQALREEAVENGTTEAGMKDMAKFVAIEDRRTKAIAAVTVSSKGAGEVTNVNRVIDVLDD